MGLRNLSFKFFFYEILFTIFNYVYVLSMFWYVHILQVPLETRGMRSLPGAGVTSSCMGARNWTWILWKSNIHSKNPSNLSSIKIYLIMCMYVCFCVWVCVGKCGYSQKPEEGFRYPGAGAGTTRCYKPADMGTGNWTSILFKSSKGLVHRATSPAFLFKEFH